MLACVLGCDSLYESGHISFDPGGHIRVSPEVDDSPHVAEHVQAYLANRTTTWWTPEREPYFAWHRNHTYRRAPVS
ncbi:hypothetical protein [Embleya sp. AB8]|uniref:hypothetical protein n=1 Tax=Embleya sp. AB8 TaxID=3156304 RepID=UPI003C72CCD7